MKKRQIDRKKGIKSVLLFMPYALFTAGGIFLKEQLPMWMKLCLVFGSFIYLMWAVIQLVSVENLGE